MKERVDQNRDLILGVLLNCFSVSSINGSDMSFTKRVEKSVTLWQNPLEMS
ncbi:hypothetical protein HOB85_00635 [Candidatus Woesearchaeota archaeon]|nr:hypothetical protein [Candidatus Woesearchaeota archaeon]